MILFSWMTELEDEKTRSMAWSANAGEARVVVVWDGGTVIRPLAPGRSLLLGRGKDCDIPVLHPTVSRQHARITGLSPPGAPMRIEDLGSAHGIRIDGELVLSGARDVWPGQVVEVGAAVVLVHEGGTSPKQAASPVGIDFDRFVTLIAKSHLPVLILGETGAGKEVMADRIHRASPRKDRPFVCLNCAAFPDTLLESELFGHEKGAFTGAVQAKPGLIETANGGTLFLDEVGELPPGAQATLLRVLETQEVRRIGSVRSFSVDVRILSATNRDLESRVREGKFRQDLVYRLNGATVRVPPLRERRQQIVPLAREILAKAAEKAGGATPAISPEAERTLKAHAWMGNVRELRNVIERAFVVAEGGTIDVQHLMLDVEPAADEAKPRTLPAEIDSLERERIVSALASVDGNQTKAAAILGISRRALINRLDAHGLPRPRKQS
jgi:two-component system, NtrC family, response regulator AtoC